MLTNILLALNLLLLALIGWRLHLFGRDLRTQTDAVKLTELRSELAGQFDQLVIQQSLLDRLDLHQGLPYSPGWSASPDFLELIVEHCLEQRPRLVFECSSGVTTLMLARCCSMNGAGRLYSLENGATYAARTRSHLQRYGLAEQGTVIDAPLQEVELEGKRFAWYAPDKIPVGEVDMLVIDGPPGFIQQHSRFPALPLLYDRLADGCVVFLDDAARPDEREIVSMWQTLYPDLECDYLDTERGCARLVVHKGR
ncbi:class I SAM-dependent methyltransferase [Candidatus Endoriftia persephone]|jgi:predicted O-methyltransferase YrrM|uniref:Class I SAM-dependent methyltransferase n=3 Tax=Gammaproteobacteria TaxID=1236 RepID=G2FDN1_9GAMM|nr:class I SAM-dependent methyltransferase [Candidatus Endoriftia persephone]EGV51473.1 hypothetical protein Rifp1Sym_bi00150 [endosymbiont of Riftia pachyptila (vent Ph05)]EGW55086.1 hypothetical protein TevJSym_af00510 [endosymbiont of Tevnia jerichonana (vent Tica)]USF88307.1 class I SAM-dependent methyltransferase [Candidatus Endoriftia persephone]